VARTRSLLLGPAARPVAAPEDLDSPRLHKATGEVRLPHHVRWSGPDLTFDLGETSDRARVYELVLQEGTDDDVRFYIDPDELLRLWDRLVLPPWVRRTWVAWFERHRGVRLEC
jgi:hypothetical protein